MMRWDAKMYAEASSPQAEAAGDLLKLASVGRAEDVLDIGCGTGALTAELARLAPEGGVTGIDPSEEMIDAAKKAAGGLSNVRLMRVSAEEMAFDSEFDLAFSNSAMQWVKAQRAALERVMSALRPGGRLAFQFPSGEFCSEFHENIESAVRTLGLGKYFEGWEPPWYLPDARQYAALLDGAGFTDVDVTIRQYRLVFASSSDALRWWASAGLRPFMEPLPEAERGRFLYAFSMGLEEYRRGRVMEFGFTRLFALARKPG
jgi:trans-aconitate methyltransferase